MMHDDNDDEDDDADDDNDADDDDDDDRLLLRHGLKNLYDNICRTILTVCSVVTMRTWSPIASSALPKSEKNAILYL